MRDPDLRSKERQWSQCHGLSRSDQLRLQLCLQPAPGAAINTARFLEQMRFVPRWAAASAAALFHSARFLYSYQARECFVDEKFQPNPLIRTGNRRKSLPKTLKIYLI